MDALVKGINLRTILKKLLWEKEKINWFYIYIFYENGIKTFLKWSINKYLKDTY